MARTALLTDELKNQLSAPSTELAAVKGNILAASDREATNTLYVTSCYGGEGKSVSALSIAYALACEGSSEVLLIDGNLRSPQLHDIFNTAQGPGITDLIDCKCTEAEAVANTDIKNLDIITAGSIDNDSLDSHNPEKLNATLISLKEKYKYIVVDGDSVLSSSDACSLAPNFDALILVVECEKTRWEVVQQVKVKIERSGGKLLGVVLNKRRYYIPRSLYGL